MTPKLPQCKVCGCVCKTWRNKFCSPSCYYAWIRGTHYRVPNSGFKKGHKPWNTGLTKETDPRLFDMGRRHSLKLTGKKRGPMPELRRTKIGNANRGKVRSPEVIEYARQKFLANCPTKRDDVKQKIRNTLARKFGDPLVRLEYGSRFPHYRGERHPNWKGGISKELYGIEFSRELKESIRMRDKYTCALCSEGGKFVHHIDYDKRNNSVTNLITLCDPCHGKTGARTKRTFWTQHLKKHLEMSLGYT